MPEKIDKARKYIALWAEDADRLKRLSQATGKTQVALAHEALTALEHHLTSTHKEPTHAR